MKYVIMFIVVVAMMMSFAQANAAGLFGISDAEWAKIIPDYGIVTPEARTVFADLRTDAAFMSDARLLVTTNLETKKIQSNYWFAYGPDPVISGVIEAFVDMYPDLGVWPSAYNIYRQIYYR